MARVIFFVGSGAYTNWGPVVGFEDKADAKRWIEERDAMLTEKQARGEYVGLDAWSDGPHELTIYASGEWPNEEAS